MALSRRSGQRFEANIWPGFVDAMTALLLVLVFVLSIFMIVQFMLSETINNQDSELDQLSDQVRTLADALGLEQQRGFNLEQEVGRLGGALQEQLDQAERQAALIASLTNRTETQAGRIASFEEQVAGLLSEREGLRGQIAVLTGERDQAADENTALTARIEDIEAGLAREISQKEALQLALAQARSEIDAGTEAARLAAARREALEALIADLEVKNASAEEALTEAEAAQLADAAAAEALRERLQNADAELTAMSLALEAQRKEAEDTLTLLAAANSAKDTLNDKLLAVLAAAQEAKTAAARSEAGLQSDLEASRQQGEETRAQLLASEASAEEIRAQLEAMTRAAEIDSEQLRAQILAALAAQQAAEAEKQTALSEAEQRQILLATAQQQLSQEKAASAESQRKIEALNQQVAALRKQLGSLQGLLDASEARDADANVQIQTLGSRLNAALAQVAAEQRRVAIEQARLFEEQQKLAEERGIRLALEEAERKRLEAEALELKGYRSEFFGQLRQLLGDQEGVRIEGDRFVFSSEVLFEPARADLSDAGQVEIAKVAAILKAVSAEIPETLDWVIRVDGHTDNTPLSGFGKYADNWELSQARALSVVRYMSGTLGIPPARLAANGFGEFQPVNDADTPEALAQNRRIELKLTEK